MNLVLASAKAGVADPYSFRTMAEGLRASPVGYHTLVVLDCCFSRGAKGALKGVFAESTDRTINKWLSASAFQAIFAGFSSDVASESAQGGLFSGAFQRELSSRAQLGKVFRARDLFNVVSEKVSDASEANQTPVWFDDGEGEVLFVPRHN